MHFRAGLRTNDCQVVLGWCCHTHAYHYHVHTTATDLPKRRLLSLSFLLFHATESITYALGGWISASTAEISHPLSYAVTSGVVGLVQLVLRQEHIYTLATRYYQSLEAQVVFRSSVAFTSVITTCHHSCGYGCSFDAKSLRVVSIMEAKHALDIRYGARVS